MGIKAPDSWTVPLCYGCHSEYDSNAWTDDKFTRLYAIHMDELLTEGALTVTGHVERTKRIKPMPKILPRRV